jgi:hypothetical protein
MYHEEIDNSNYQKLGLSNQHSESSLSDIFFSKTNMKRIQNKIRKEVLIRTKNKFRLDTDQDDSDLLIVMRGIYFDQGKFLPYNIIHQVKDLNKKVVDYVVPDIITGIKQYYGYIHDISTPLQPIPRPVNVNDGKRTLPSLTSVMGF